MSPPSDIRVLRRRPNTKPVGLCAVLLAIILLFCVTVLPLAFAEEAAATDHVAKVEEEESPNDKPKLDGDASAHEEHLHRLRVPPLRPQNQATTDTAAEAEDPAEAHTAKDEESNADESSSQPKDAAGPVNPDTRTLDEPSKEKVLRDVGEKAEEHQKVDNTPADLSTSTADEKKTAENHGEDETGESAAKSDDHDDEEENPQDYYFYAFDEASPVVELPRYEGDADLAPFLDNPNPGEIRIVEFYAHWCPHCEKFRPKFNKFAKRMMEIAEQSGLKLKIYAISCVPHKSVCRGNGVKNYPRVKMYLADSTTPIEINHRHVHPFEVLKKLGEQNAFQDVEEEWDMEQEEEEHEHAPDSAAVLLGSGESFWIPRTKKEIYHDAYLSFDFMMRNSIFTSKEPMSEDAQESFADFIHVLSEVSPPTWRLQWLVAEIAENIEDALQSEEKLLAIVDNYPPRKKKWSKSCTRGKGHMGYTCGLWQLFHIMTIGVVEWNLNNVAGKKKTYYATHEAAEVLRYFVEHFFGCEVCRINFVQEYDSCSFSRCERLADRVGEFNDWKELPLWLFEFHNGVNTRLLKERAETQGVAVSLDEMASVEWPARNHCPACWHGDGRFDPDRVYMFLELIYWPDELISKSKMAELVAFTSHKQRLRGVEEEDPILEDGFESWVYSLAGLVIASTILSAASWAHKQKEIQRTGKHKKEDDESVKC